MPDDASQNAPRSASPAAAQNLVINWRSHVSPMSLPGRFDVVSGRNLVGFGRFETLNLPLRIRATASCQMSSFKSAPNYDRKTLFTQL